jgi:hypothetical protein
MRAAVQAKQRSILTCGEAKKNFHWLKNLQMKVKNIFHF